MSQPSALQAAAAAAAEISAAAKHWQGTGMPFACCSTVQEGSWSNLLSATAQSKLVGFQLGLPIAQQFSNPLTIKPLSFHSVIYRLENCSWENAWPVPLLSSWDLTTVWLTTASASVAGGPTAGGLSVVLLFVLLRML